MPQTNSEPEQPNKKKASFPFATPGPFSGTAASVRSVPRPMSRYPNGSLSWSILRRCPKWPTFTNSACASGCFNLPLMVAVVLTMIWRQIGEATQVVRLMQKESLFWAQPRRITQQALSQRFGTLPAELFLKVLESRSPGDAHPVAGTATSVAA